MKFRVTMKDPDTLHDSIAEEVKRAVKEIPGLNDRERVAVEEARHEELSDFANKWMGYGEYLTVEFDTDAGTATVIPDK